jgi:hypothetical protein
MICHVISNVLSSAQLITRSAEKRSLSQLLLHMNEARMDDTLAKVINDLLDDTDAIPVHPTRLLVRARLRSPAWRQMDPTTCVATLCRLRRDSLLETREIRGHLYAANRDRQSVVASLLVTKEYRQLGMTVLPIGEKGEDWESCCNWLPYVPFSCEHRFLEFLPSRFGGLGLFLRQGRQLRPGTVAAEYHGVIHRHRKREDPSYRLKQRPEDHPTLHAYSVSLSGPCAGFEICGIDSAGELQSLAPLANDNGPAAANVKLIEFPEYPRRVFFVTTRPICAGDELLTEYGAKFWGYDSYEEIATAMRRNGGVLPSRVREVHATGGGYSEVDALQQDVVVHCRSCGKSFPRRVKKLHKAECGDALAHVSVCRLDSLPRNEFTDIDQASWRRGVTCENFVNFDYSWTLFNTHFHRREDVKPKEDVHFPRRKKRSRT